MPGLDTLGNISRLLFGVPALPPGPFPLFNPSTTDPTAIPSGRATFDGRGVVTWENPYLWAVKIRNYGEALQVETYSDGYGVSLGEELLYYSRDYSVALRFVLRLKAWGATY